MYSDALSSRACLRLHNMSSVSHPRTAERHKENSISRGSLFLSANSGTFMLLFVRSKVKLLTLPLIPPQHTHTYTHTLLPSAAKALSTESPYLHGLDFFHAEERNLVHSRSPRSGPHRQSGHVIHRRTMTILWGSERGGGWREAPRFWPELERRSRPPPTPFPFRPQQSPALVPLGSRGKTPSALLTRANKACPLWTRWRCQKLLGWWVEGGVGGW